MSQMKSIIKVRDVCKRYRIGTAKPSFTTLRDYVAHSVRASLGRNKGNRPTRKDGAGAARLDEFFWALNGVNFDVMPGEVVGIIGRNGAGKSTLLKTLSRITEPTLGRIELYGRVGSLLEVGTGFHPELSGRENIYLNGAILGMSRSEITSNFDEIVAFAEIEKFLETPVKRYSSGMYMRLAFAVAAHLDPEILLVDEVLAVGDLEFQKKCLGKMQDIAKSGRTILFVSHNMSAISSLCDRLLLLNKGEVEFSGSVAEGISRYVSTVEKSATADLTEVTTRQGPGEYARLTSLSVFDGAGRACDTFAMGQPLTIRLRLLCKEPLKNAEVGVAITNSVSVSLHYLVSNWEGLDCNLDVGVHEFEVTVPELTLYPGTYVLTPWIKRQGLFVDDEVDDALAVAVIGADITGHSPYFERYKHSGCETYARSTWRKLNTVESCGSSEQTALAQLAL